MINDRKTPLSLKACLFFFFFLAPIAVFSQNHTAANLGIAPDARASAMGDLGVATSPDESSIFWNPAKMAFLKANFGGILSYSPSLFGKPETVSLFYASGFKRLGKDFFLGLSVNYASELSSKISDETGIDLGHFKPYDAGIDLSLAKKFSETFSIGYTVRYVQSDFLNAQFMDGGKTANAVAMDLGMNFLKKIRSGNELSFGFSLTNFGTKLDFGVGNPVFLPMNTRLGVNYRVLKTNVFSIGLEVSKPLVPEKKLSLENEQSTLQAAFSSFNDMENLSYSSGVEYIFPKILAVRAGIRYQNPDFGANQYATFGLAYPGQKLNIGMSYAIGLYEYSISNAFRISLSSYF